MPRGTSSCWTCRIRHKKCDETLPVCNVCAGLEISCYSDQEVPEWMDGGARQQAMAERLKTEVRNGAKRRRARRILQRIIGDADDISSDIFVLDPPAHINSRPAPRSADNDNERHDAPRTTSRRTGTPSRSFTNSPGSDYPIDPLLQEITPPSLPNLPTELEQSYIMSYIDYIFPAVFPFYTPSVLEGGRTWLLILTLANKSLCHAATSLSSYFYSVVPVQQRPERRECVPEAENEVQNQTCMAMRKAQFDLNEVSIASNENWQFHLDAAVLLFKQMLEFPGDVGSHRSKWDAMLEHMRRLAHPGMDNPPRWPAWTVDQAAFRFFSGLLIVHDIIYSTGVEQIPRLQPFYPLVLAAEDEPKEDPDRNCRLRLEDYVGCQNWAMILVGEVAALDGWKKTMQKKGALSLMHLVKKGADIERSLRDGLSRLETIDATARDHRPPWLADSNQAHDEAEACHLVTQIWAHAGLVYLHVVLSGWQPANIDIADSVAQTIELYIVEGVWQKRESIAADSWDVAACLNSLGRRVLLG
ncbi:Pestheic acid cluster transcriptional regulator 3 [Colletotrichum sp. SAR 10_70]|nr:Pestheic acid cluster transcriptional regulator 3 [Colletotrichum sp. SAR 10_71]KAI8196623.1 Pestheic acid cluster transcriptional regulator 3 [Colletotrichum sp. SAR 10_70]